MIRFLILFSLAFFQLCLSTHGRHQTKMDSLKSVIRGNAHDTARVKAMNKLAEAYISIQPDSSLVLAQQALQLSKKNDFIYGLTQANYNLGYAHYILGNFDSAIQYWKKNLEIRKSNNLNGVSNSYNNLAVIHLAKSNYPKALEYFRKSRGIYRDLGDSSGVASSYNNIGYVHSQQSNYAKAMKCYKNSLEISKKLGDQKQIAYAYNNLGELQRLQSNFPQALKYYHKALTINKRLGNKGELATLFNNIGIIYYRQEEMLKSIEYHKKSLQLKKELGQKKGLASSYNNIGNVHESRSHYLGALQYYLKALEIYQTISAPQQIARTYNNIGSTITSLYEVSKNNKDTTELNTTLGELVSESNEIYRFLAKAKDWSHQDPEKLIDTAFVFQQKALKIQKELRSTEQITHSLIGIATIYFKQNRYHESLEHYQQALRLADSVGSFRQSYIAHKGLSNNYEKLNSPNKALHHYKKHTTLKDSVFNEKKQKEIGRLEAKAKYEKQQAIEETNHEKELEKQRAIAQAEQERQNLIIIAVSGGLGLVLLFSVFLFNRFRITRKQKNIIEHQKDEVQLQKELVEEKNTEITSSIQYASRIQNAILPPSKLIKQHLSNAFILYKPKDIVAGDFYWLEAMHNRIYFTAADCTGHGVPGAMVSVMCSNALSKSVKELNIKSPAKILDKSVELLEEQFAKSEEDVKDGMDLALCCLDLDQNKLEYAGANNPLYYIRNGELTEVKADKQPVGKHDQRTPFTNHVLDVQQGDLFYIFSDGYPDQFGGSKGKKFKNKKLKQLLLDHHEKSMQEQKQILDETIEDWMGNLEQVDDICIMGVKA